jgi:hypothetical protein
MFSRDAERSAGLTRVHDDWLVRFVPLEGREGERIDTPDPDGWYPHNRAGRQWGQDDGELCWVGNSRFDGRCHDSAPIGRHTDDTRSGIRVHACAPRLNDESSIPRPQLVLDPRLLARVRCAE